MQYLVPAMQCQAQTNSRTLNQIMNLVKDIALRLLLHCWSTYVTAKPLQILGVASRIAAAVSFSRAVVGSSLGAYTKDEVTRLLEMTHFIRKPSNSK